jgi:acetyltransferase EpsM
MREKLIIIGGGEHARVVAEAAHSRPDLWDLQGFVERKPCPRMEQESGLACLGTDEDASFLACAATSTWFVLGVGGIGPSTIRRDLIQRYAAAGNKWASIIHSTAHVSPSATVGKGAVILSGVVVNCGAVLGDHCVINSGAVIEHDVRVGSFVQVSTGSVIGGGAVLEEDCYVGLGARVRDHVTVGSGAMVGMGAAVVATVPMGLTVVGVPARVRKQ